MHSSPRIAVVGCGALGSFYGARLVRAGFRIHFLLRSDYDVVRSRGVRVLDAQGGFVVSPNCAREPAEIGPCDLVLIALKTTANAEFPRLLPPLVGAETAVLTLQNGLGNEEKLAEVVGSHSVLGGLCFVCLNRVEPGVIQHIAHGRIVMGEFGRAVSARARAIASWFQKADVPCDLTDELERAHWEKLVWNIPFNGLGVSSAAGIEGTMTGHLNNGHQLGPCLATDSLLSDPRWFSLVRELMSETIRSARAQNLFVPDTAADEQIQRTREMGAYRASSLIDFERGLPIELESMFLEPLRRSKVAGVPTPRLAALCRILSELDGLRRERVN